MITHEAPPTARPREVTVAYFLRSFPRLSQTFILSEMLLLEAQGVSIRILALADSRESLAQMQIEELRASVTYLGELVPTSAWKGLLLHLHLFLRTPLRYLRALACLAVAGKDHESGYSNYSRFRCFSMAACAATLLHARHHGGERTQHLHAHFAHDPTFVALLVHLLTGLTYSFTAHARDLYQIKRRSLVRRAAKATHVITCCSANRDYLDSTLPVRVRSRIRLIHHGVDSRLFRPPSAGIAEGASPKVVAVGRLVKKKGFADLLRACAVVAARHNDFTCLIFGDGPERADLSSIIEAMRLERYVRLMGSCTQRDLVGAYQSADIFALTPYVTEDGDRDGIPNVLMEAMACGLPVLTTDSGGISELVTHGANGLVTAPRDVDGIAAGLQTLLQNAELRTRLGAAARDTVTKGFDSRIRTAELATIFRAFGGAPCPSPA